LCVGEETYRHPRSWINDPFQSITLNTQKKVDIFQPTVNTESEHHLDGVEVSTQEMGEANYDGLYDGASQV